MIDLRRGDCLDVMGTIADGSIDLVCADLPYATTSMEWDQVIPFEPLWSHYRRLLKSRGTVVLTASQPFTTDLIQSNREWFKYELIWKKTVVGGFVHAKNKPLKAHENIILFSPATTVHESQTLNRMTYQPQGLTRIHKKHFRPKARTEKSVVGSRPSHTTHTTGYTQEWTGYPTSIIEIANPNNGNVHPTQKPVALMEYLIRTYSNEGETVLDNCFGSCTTGIAAINTNRNFIGIEKDEKYFNIGKARVDSHLRDISCQLPLS